MRQAETSQWLLPLITGGSWSSAPAVCGVGFCVGGGCLISFFPGSSEADLSCWRRRRMGWGGLLEVAVLPLSCVNFQDQLIIRDPNNQMWDSLRSRLSFDLFPECLRDSQTWLRQKSDRPSSNTRQGDRQTKKKKKMLINAFTPDRMTQVFLSKQNRSLSHADGCRLWTKTCKFNRPCPARLIDSATEPT